MGRAILAKAKLLLFMVDTQIDRTAAITQGMAGSLSIGLTAEFVSGPLHYSTAEFHQSHPT